MVTDQDYQEHLFIAIERAAGLTKELGHPPLLGEGGLDEVLQPLLPPMEVHQGISPSITWVTFGAGGPDPSKLEHDHGDPVARAVIADLLYRPAQVKMQAAVDDCYTGDDEEGPVWEDVDSADYFASLREYLAGLTPHEIHSESALLWEVQAAAASGDTPRLVQVCDELLARHPSPVNRAIAARTVFIAVGSKVPAYDRSDFQGDLPSERTLLYWAVAVNRVSQTLDAALGLERPRRPSPSPEELATLLRVISWIAQLRIERQLDEVLRLVAACCEYELGVVLSEPQRCFIAAKEFEKRDPDSLLHERMVQWLDEATAVGYMRAGRSDLAEDVLRKMCDLQASADRFLRLAKCRHLQGKQAETLDAFEAYVQHRGDAAPKEQFQATLAIEYGLSMKSLRQRTDLLGALAMSTPVREQGEQLVSWLEPTYEHLSEPARNKWWKGLYGLSSPSYRKDVGDEVWNEVAAAFGESVNLELKARIYRPFLAAVPDRVAAAAEPWNNPTAEQAVLLGRGTLGQHIEVLLQSRSPVRPVARSLDQWLKTNHAPLCRYLKTSRANQDLLTLNKLRGQATHHTVSREEAVRLFELAKDVLRVLVEA